MKTDSEIGPAYDPTQALKTDIFKTYELDDKQVDQYDLDRINNQQLKNFDQFQKNEELTGKKSTYDFNLYTVNLQKDGKHTEQHPEQQISRQEVN